MLPKIYLLLFMFLLLGCGRRQWGEKKSLVPTTSVGEDFVRRVGNLGSTEKVVAIRVCDSFAKKRIKFATLIGETFNFYIVNKDCDGQIQYENVTTQLKLANGNHFSFEGSSNFQINKEVHTDNYGLLDEACPLINAGQDAPSSRAYRSDTVNIYFEKVDTLHDLVRVTYAGQDSQGKVIVSKEEKYTIFLDSNPLDPKPNQKGQVVFFERFFYCASSDKETYLTQTFKP